LEGKKARNNLMIQLNDDLVTDQNVLAEAFADFFQSKVENLSGGYGDDDYNKGTSTLTITAEEIKQASKLLKSKYCQGEDGIPMKVVKDIGCTRPDMLVSLFNNCCKKGLPKRWKTAIIIPLHKNGPKTQLTRYRPISNLDALSKLFEKVILKRLDILGELDGQFQHGFKQKRSTTTAMLELQDHLATKLDEGKIIGTYSLDLSAAFDLLRPDIFYKQMKNTLPADILNVLMDFLSGRHFQVQIGNKRSKERLLKVGCVQGSILGPRLFTLYISHLQSMINEDTSVISYADDTYVSVSAKTLPEVKLKLTEQILRHNEMLKEVGMVTNVSKTKLIYFGRKPIMDMEPLEINGDLITPTSTMKVLGVLFDNNMGWNSQLEKVLNKAKIVIKKMNFLRKYVNQDGMKRILTSHFYGLVYYATPVWLGKFTPERSWKLLESAHYRALRATVGDHLKLWTKKELDDTLGRATPKQWMEYCTCKTAIQLMNLKEKGPPMSMQLINQQYINDRLPLKTKIFDASKKKCGRFSLRNRLDFFEKIDFDWRNDISTDLLRINLKKTFIKMT